MNKIQVIMPVFIKNDATMKLTQEAVKSLGDVFLILIDNNSNLEYGDELRSLADLYLRNRVNLGYARAVNQGLKLAGQGLVAISNNDIRTSSNWQDIAKEIFRMDSKVYSCHFRMIAYDAPMIYGNLIATTGKERWCTSSFFVIHKQWRMIPEEFLYDENFLNSYDDWDFWYRMRQKGLKSAYTNMACYQHHDSFTQKQIPEHGENNLRNQEYFKQKHGGYAEDLFAKEFPDQVKVPYKEGFGI